MKQAVVTVLTAVAAVMLTYYLNLKSPDLRYQLSIPIELEAGTPGTLSVVQQLEIANLGNAVAEKIQVKIRNDVGSLRVTKDSESDIYQQFESSNGATELVYDSLRPAGRFQIVLTGGQRLLEEDVEIRDLGGFAKPAFASEPGFWSLLVSVSPLVAVGFYLWLSARSIATDNIAFESVLDPAATLERRKPLLVPHNRWESILEKAASLPAGLKMTETTDVSSWEVYRLLNSKRPEHLADDTWNRVVIQLRKSFIARVEAVSSRAQVHGRTEEIRKLLATRKPLAVFDEPWDQLVKSISKMYVAALWAHDTRWLLPFFPGLATRLAESKPDGLAESDWQKYREWLQCIYFLRGFEDLQSSVEPMEDLQRVDLSLLSASQTKTLKELAYYLEMRKLPSVHSPEGAEEFLKAGKPTFMTERDYEQLTKAAQTAKRTAEDKRRYSALGDALRDLLKGYPLATAKPTAILDDDWADLQRIERNIVAASEENRRKDKELTLLESEISTLVTKVRRQLEIINAFISDPGVLDRIEEYDGLFAPGNLENLRQIARLRRSTAAQ